MGEQRILVTGGAGFIGSRTVRQLAQSSSAEAPVKVWVLDNLHAQVHGPNAQPPAFPDNVTFVKGDVGDRPRLTQLLTAAQPTHLIHMAAETGTGQSMDEICRYCQVNVMGTAVLLEAIAQTTTPLQRFILMSSRAVYGEGAYWDDVHRKTVVPPPRRVEDLKQGRFDPIMPGANLRAVPTPESTPVAPSSIYASTKLMQEHLVQQAGASALWQATLLRFQNVYGPGQSLKNPYTGVLSIFSEQILSDKILNIYEDGQIGRDFVFVDDVVAALLLACKTPVPHGSVINIGSGQTTTILEAAQQLLRLYGRSPDAYTITGDFRAGDIRHAVADIQVAKRLLGWQPQVSLADGLSKLAVWCESVAIAS
ncbi:MAG: NAD-dependent epimerase/dehydratase family protein [Phormidesmis sp.]